MIDILWSEIIIIGIVALIFLGPSELLILFKTIGKFLGKLQEMAQHFKMAIDHEVYKKEEENETYDVKIKQSEDNES
jgi:sec-independent protein translocase protein TatB